MSGPTRVLFSFGPPTADANPYTTLLADYVARDASVSFFSWKTALLGDYDVFHVQWPESMVRPYRQNRTAPAVRALKFALAASTLLLGRVRGRALVWTVHNRTPHERGPILERLFIRLFHRLVSHRIYLNTGETDEHGRPSSVIRHPDYAPVATRPTSATAPHGLLLFGHLRPYKGVEELVDLVASSPGGESLLVVGNAADPAYGRALVERARTTENVTVEARLVEQSELSALIASSSLVVLPYRYVYNSGSLLLALTLHTPVLVRESETTRAIRDEVGSEWVTTFDGDLSADDVVQALRAAGNVDRAVGPNLAARSWDECGQRHVRLYDGLRPGR